MHPGRDDRLIQTVKRIGGRRGGAWNTGGGSPPRAVDHAPIMSGSSSNITSAGIISWTGDSGTWNGADPPDPPWKAHVVCSARTGDVMTAPAVCQTDCPVGA